MYATKLETITIQRKRGRAIRSYACITSAGAPAFPGVRNMRKTIKGRYKRAFVAYLATALDGGLIESLHIAYTIGVVLSDPTVSDYVYLADTDRFNYSPQERMEFILVRASAVAGRLGWISFEREEEICEIITKADLEWISHHGVKMHHENLRAPEGDSFSYYTHEPKSRPVLSI